MHEPTGCEADYYAFDVPGNPRHSAGDRARRWAGSRPGAACVARKPSSRARRRAGRRRSSIGNADLAAQMAANPGGMASRLSPGARDRWGLGLLLRAPRRRHRQSRCARPAGRSSVRLRHARLRQRHNEVFDNFHGASGFSARAGRIRHARLDHQRRAVTARLIPNIGELALEASDGVLLRRSNAALFDALARRPRAGGRAGNATRTTEVDPYIPIPSVCVGPACATSILPEYTLTSSNPDDRWLRQAQTSASPDPHAMPLQRPGDSRSQRTRRRRTDPQAKIVGPVLRLQRRHDDRDGSARVASRPRCR